MEENDVGLTIRGADDFLLPYILPEVCVGQDTLSTMLSRPATKKKFNRQIPKKTMKKKITTWTVPASAASHFSSERLIHCVLGGFWEDSCV